MGFCRDRSEASCDAPAREVKRRFLHHVRGESRHVRRCESVVEVVSGTLSRAVQGSSILCSSNMFTIVHLSGDTGRTAKLLHACCSCFSGCR